VPADSLFGLDDPASQWFSSWLLGKTGSIKLAKEWLKNCLQTHELCAFGCTKQLSSLPTRVIDVGPADGSEEPYLLVTKEKLGEWITLTHCWGKAQPLTTTTANLEHRKSSIPFQDFPPLFQDAITITRKLGYRHIWIDSLCIIQDSHEDWASESAKMGSIYEHAVLCIAADSCRDNKTGIFKSCHAALEPEIDFAFKVPWKHGSEIGYLYPRPQRKAASEWELNPVRQRCWTFQEQYLSPRLLSWTDMDTVWTCRSGYFTLGETEHRDSYLELREKYFRQLHEHAAVLQADCHAAVFKDPINTSTGTYRLQTVFWLWKEIVKEFTMRSITRDTDRLISLAGIAETVSKSANLTYLAGLWGENLHAGLIWATMRSANPRRTTGYVAPSWSWASVVLEKTPVFSLDHPEDFSADYDFDQAWTGCQFVDVSVVPRDGNGFGQLVGGMLTLRAPARWVKRKAYLASFGAGDFYFDIQDEEEAEGEVLWVQVRWKDYERHVENWKEWRRGEGKTDRWDESMGPSGPRGQFHVFGLLLEPVENGEWQEGEEVFRRVGCARMPWARFSALGPEDKWQEKTLKVV
jgi:hypothetical protein